MKAKVVCIGDSFTDGQGVERKHTWPTAVSEQLGVEVINCGISGDTTLGMLSRFWTEVLPEKPTHVIITGGVNDRWFNLDPNITLANYYSMINVSRTHNIVPIAGIQRWFSPDTLERNKKSPHFVWEPLGGYEACWGQIVSFATKLIKLCEESGVDFIDFTLKDEENVHKDLLLKDGLHLNEKGHQAIANIVVDFFKAKGF